MVCADVALGARVAVVTALAIERRRIERALLGDRVARVHRAGVVVVALHPHAGAAAPGAHVVVRAVVAVVTAGALVRRAIVEASTGGRVTAVRRAGLVVVAVPLRARAHASRVAGLVDGARNVVDARCALVGGGIVGAVAAGARIRRACVVVVAVLADTRAGPPIADVGLGAGVRVVALQAVRRDRVMHAVSARRVARVDGASVLIGAGLVSPGARPPTADVGVGAQVTVVAPLAVQRRTEVQAVAGRGVTRVLGALGAISAVLLRAGARRVGAHVALGARVTVAAPGTLVGGAVVDAVARRGVARIVGADLLVVAGLVCPLALTGVARVALGAQEAVVALHALQRSRVVHAVAARAIAAIHGARLVVGAHLVRPSARATRAHVGLRAEVPVVAAIAVGPRPVMDTLPGRGVARIHGAVVVVFTGPLLAAAHAGRAHVIVRADLAILAAQPVGVHRRVNARAVGLVAAVLGTVVVVDAVLVDPSALAAGAHVGLGAGVGVVAAHPVGAGCGVQALAAGGVAGVDRAGVLVVAVDVGPRAAAVGADIGRRAGIAVVAPATFQRLPIVHAVAGGGVAGVGGAGLRVSAGFVGTRALAARAHVAHGAQVAVIAADALVRGAVVDAVARDRVARVGGARLIVATGLAGAATRRPRAGVVDGARVAVVA